MQLSDTQIASVMSSIENVHWMDGNARSRNDGHSFIVRFNAQASINLIRDGLPKLKSFSVELGNGKKNYVRVDPDLTKKQRDEQHELIRARAVLKQQNRNVSNVRMHNAQGFYIVVDGTKHFKESVLVTEALKKSHGSEKNDNA